MNYVLYAMYIVLHAMYDILCSILYVLHRTQYTLLLQIFSHELVRVSLYDVPGRQLIDLDVYNSNLGFRSAKNQFQNGKTNL